MDGEQEGGIVMGLLEFIYYKFLIICAVLLIYYILDLCIVL